MKLDVYLVLPMKRGQCFIQYQTMDRKSYKVVKGKKQFKNE
jgi:hypothetical protein